MTPNDYANVLKTAMNAAEVNGFGFRYLHDDRSVSIARIWITEAARNRGFKMDEAQIQRYLQMIAPSAICKTYISRTYIIVNIMDWECIPPVFQALIDHGDLGVTVDCVLDAVFEPGDKWSWAETERRAIATSRNDYATVLDSQDIYSSRKKHWNWQTAEGKEFCSELRAKFRTSRPVARCSQEKCFYMWKNVDQVCRAYGVLHRGGWSAYEPSLVTLDAHILVAPPAPHHQLPAQISKRARIDEEEKKEGKSEEEKPEDEGDEVVCMICFENQPNTLVIPCMHCVVCTICSEKLTETADKKTCVRCRRPIEVVLVDEK